MTIDPMGSLPRVLYEPVAFSDETGPCGAWLSAPTWSPDGVRIADPLAYSTGNGQEPRPVIASFGLDSEDEPALLHQGEHVGDLDWSPDGHSIVFDRRTSDATLRIFVLEPESGELRQVIPDATDPTVSRYDDFDPAWAPLDH